MKIANILQMTQQCATSKEETSSSADEFADIFASEMCCCPQWQEGKKSVVTWLQDIKSQLENHHELQDTPSDEAAFCSLVSEIKQIPLQKDFWPGVSQELSNNEQVIEQHFDVLQAKTEVLCENDQNFPMESFAAQDLASHPKIVSQLMSDTEPTDKNLTVPSQEKVFFNKINLSTKLEQQTSYSRLEEAHKITIDTKHNIEKPHETMQEMPIEMAQKANMEAQQRTNIEAIRETNIRAIQAANVETNAEVDVETNVEEIQEVTDETTCEQSATHNKTVVKELSPRSSVYMHGSEKIEDKITQERMETFYLSRNAENRTKNSESIDMSSPQNIFEIENLLEENDVQVNLVDSQEIDLQLKYGDENDDVHLNIAMKEDTLFLKVGSEQQETLELLKNNIESLRRDLLQKGLKLHDVEFSRNFSQSFSQNSNHRGNQHFLQQRFSAKVEENAREVNPNQIYYSNKKVSYYI
ncbi:flagellar hook-length control protein FliK [Candidatus Uabimicrobium amorphum]|uniref:Flagellar hook-length control protein-like C-terminal domain-containing protein n=1 Tax=Uabimicrobium amorphum TaxID=2596890 RepID=A0A5S9F468_UABAM|nr:flagellar hook-length control protein FliK [Candidatus Uabimicrobium amorphum]BBM84991.1 hypothetical protein UABAM_03354 [Candidatus Uabimicrobium amorphum]